MTDAYLVAVMLVLMCIGGLMGAGVTIVAYRRRELLDHRRKAALSAEGEAASSRDFLDLLVSRFDSLEERVDFAEQLMLDRRPDDRGSGPA